MVSPHEPNEQCSSEDTHKCDYCEERFCDCGAEAHTPDECTRTMVAQARAIGINVADGDKYMVSPQRRMTDYEARNEWGDRRRSEVARCPAVAGDGCRCTRPKEHQGEHIALNLEGSHRWFDGERGADAC